MWPSFENFMFTNIDDVMATRHCDSVRYCKVVSSQEVQ